MSWSSIASVSVVATLLAALAATFVDPAFVTEATRSGLRVNPCTGEHVQALIADYTATPKAVVDQRDTLIATDSAQQGGYRP